MDFFSPKHEFKSSVSKNNLLSSFERTDNYLFNHQILPFNTAAKLTQGKNK
jgi:hypothetical protein